VNGRKILSVLAVLFMIFYVINSPAEAAAIVKSTQHVVAHGFNSLSEFIRNL